MLVQALWERLAMHEVPVLIAGGGPVGMTLALELARYGVRSMLVERNPTTTRHPKMDITNGRSMELFRRLSLAPSLRAVGVPARNVFDVSWLTSLSGHELHRFHYPTPDEKRLEILERNDGSQASEPPLRVSQIVIEPVLKAAIDANPLIDVRFGTSFEGIVRNDNDGVVSEIVDFVSGERTIVKSQHLAGCDGGGSKIRRELGIETDGEYNAARAYMVHFRSDDRAILQRWGVAWHYQNGSGSLIAQNDKDIWTLQAWIVPGTDEATLTPEAVLETWVGQSFDYEILQANPWSAHLVVAQQYVVNRVALAGDAAHQYIPTGGYGMNSGIGDVAGLGWVLAASVQGWGGPQLLDAYGIERRATAWNCLAASRRHMHVRRQIAELYAMAGDLESDGSSAECCRAEVAQGIAALGNAENESWGVELGYRYDASPIVVAEPNAPEIDPLLYKGSTWPGSRLPHIFLTDGSALHDRLGLYFTLILFDDQIDPAPLEEAAAASELPLTVLRLAEPVPPVFEAPLLLVRPDQHIAWRGHALPADCGALLAKISGWQASMAAQKVA
jgi:2-polyprenyl-6-methoxyphenol hydroxylase-like FAD-dependent oxidoreductase